MAAKRTYFCATLLNKIQIKKKILKKIFYNPEQ